MPISPFLAKIIFALALIFGFILSFLYGGTAMGDDTFIYMRYVGYALRDGIYYYNTGEQSFGATSPLWVYIMTVVAPLLNNDVLIWKFISGLFFGLSISTFMYTIWKYITKEIIFIVLGSLLALEPFLLRWSSTGMENSLVLFGLVVTLHLSIKLLNTPPNYLDSIILVITSAVLPFIRPELALFSIAIICVAFCKRPNNRWFILYLLLMGIIFLGLLAKVYLDFGSILPQTGTAKSIFLKQIDSFYAIRQSIQILIAGASGILLIIGLYLWQYRLSTKFSIMILILLFIEVICIAYLGYQNFLVSTRYASILAVPLVIIGLITVPSLLQASKLKRILVWLCLGVYVIASVGLLYLQFPATRAPEVENIRAVAEFAKVNLASESRIALTEIGVFGYYSDFYIIDMVGLVDRATLEWGEEHGETVNTQEELEELLIYRNATHYIDTYSSSIVEGNLMDFRLLGEFNVSRNNLSGNSLETIWRFYAIEPKP